MKRILIIITACLLLAGCAAAPTAPDIAATEASPDDIAEPTTESTSAPATEETEAPPTNAPAESGDQPISVDNVTGMTEIMVIDSGDTSSAAFSPDGSI